MDKTTKKKVKQEIEQKTSEKSDTFTTLNFSCIVKISGYLDWRGAIALKMTSKQYNASITNFVIYLNLLQHNHLLYQLFLEENTLDTLMFYLQEFYDLDCQSQANFINNLGKIVTYHHGERADLESLAYYCLGFKNELCPLLSQFFWISELPAPPEDRSNHAYLNQFYQLAIQVWSQIDTIEASLRDGFLKILHANKGNELIWVAEKRELYQSKENILKYIPILKQDDPVALTARLPLDPPKKNSSLLSFFPKRPVSPDSPATPRLQHEISADLARQILTLHQQLQQEVQQLSKERSCCRFFINYELTTKKIKLGCLHQLKEAKSFAELQTLAHNGLKNNRITRRYYNTSTKQHQVSRTLNLLQAIIHAAPPTKTGPAPAKTRSQ